MGEMKMDKTRSDIEAAYNAGHRQGEIVNRTGKSSDAFGPPRWVITGDLEAEWHDGYHDALSGVYAPADCVGR